MRVAFFVRERVMLAVDRHPLLRAEPGRQPQREAKHERDGGMQNERAVGRGTVEIDGGAHHRDLNEDGGDDEAHEERKQHPLPSEKDGPWPR